MQRRIISLGFVLTILVMASLSTTQANANTTGSDEDFQFNITPYAWLTGMNGTVGVRGAQATVDKSFADLSQSLNIAAMVHADVLYRGTVGILGEFNYSQLGGQASGKRVSLDAKSSLILSDVAAYYRLGTASLGKNGGIPINFDLLAGARIWSLGLSLNTDGPLAGRSVNKQKSWVDPIVGARTSIRFNDKWNLDLRGGVGGFGISSALTWDAGALLGYTFWEHGTLLLGYRAVSVNHDEGSGKSYFKFNTTLHGPIIGVAFTF